MTRLTSKTWQFDLPVVLTTFALASVHLPANAGLVVGHVTDKNAQSVANAVLFAVPLDTPVPAAKPGTSIVVAQANYAFNPYVSVIRTGSLVRFPNRDAHEHHLKSFSPAKTFELRIDSKKQDPTPILFDKAGEVAVVCHFHDWMRGYIYVVDTPYFAKTDADGNAVLNQLPAGKYAIKAWAPNMLGEPLSQIAQIPAENAINLKFQFSFVPKPAPTPRHPVKSAAPFGYDN